MVYHTAERCFMKKLFIVLLFSFLFTGCLFSPFNKMYNQDKDKTIESSVIVINNTNESLYYCIFEDTYISTTNMNTFLNQNNFSLNYLRTWLVTYNDKFIANFGKTFENNGEDVPLYKETIYLYKNSPYYDDNLKPGAYKFVLYRKNYVKENQYSSYEYKKFYINSTTFYIRENSNTTININSDYSLSVY